MGLHPSDNASFSGTALDTLGHGLITDEQFKEVAEKLNLKIILGMQDVKVDSRTTKEIFGICNNCYDNLLYRHKDIE